jgi:hypothetical protein
MKRSTVPSFPHQLVLPGSFHTGDIIVSSPQVFGQTTLFNDATYENHQSIDMK